MGSPAGFAQQWLPGAGNPSTSAHTTDRATTAVLIVDVNDDPRSARRSRPGHHQTRRQEQSQEQRMERAESQGHRGRDPAGQLTGSPVITTFAQRHRPCCPGRYWSARPATPQPPPRCGRSPACSPTHPVNVLPRSPSPRPTTCAPRATGHGARGTGHGAHPPRRPAIPRRGPARTPERTHTGGPRWTRRNRLPGMGREGDHAPPPRSPRRHPRRPHAANYNMTEQLAGLVTVSLTEHDDDAVRIRLI